MKTSSGFIWERALRYDDPAQGNLMMGGGCQSAGFGFRALCEPGTRQDFNSANLKHRRPLLTAEGKA